MPRSTQRRVSSGWRACHEMRAAASSAFTASPRCPSISNTLIAATVSFSDTVRSPAMRAPAASSILACPSRERSPSHPSSRKSTAVFAARIVSSGLNDSSERRAWSSPYSTVFSGTSPSAKW